LLLLAASSCIERLMHQGINDNMQLIFRNATFLHSYYNVNESGGIYGFLLINQYMQPLGT
jgi:hypothetical protein